MLARSLFLFLFIISTFQSRIYSQIENKPAMRDFYVLTIPKSGSFLVQKLLVLLTKKTYVNPHVFFPAMDAFRFHDYYPDVYIPKEKADSFFAKIKKINQFSLAHFNFAETAYHFSLRHPEYVKILQIRDLRDACVSCAFHMANSIQEEIGPSTFDEKLLFVITMGDRPTWQQILNIYKNAHTALEWINDKNVVISRFENLVGVKGGSTLESQQKQIIEIANSLNIAINQEKIDYITNNLFGLSQGIGTPTFREGKIGSWQKYFKEEHKIAFKKHFGKLQVAFGYSLE